MDVGQIKGSYAPAVLATTEPRKNNKSVATDLPRTETVKPVDKAEKSDKLKDEPQKTEKPELEAQSRTDVTFDSRTQSSVFQQVDAETGELKQQFPSEAIMKLRAYVRILGDLESSGSVNRSA